MGEYTTAAASTFNGFPTTETSYVCSVLPEHFPNVVVEGSVGTDNVVHAAGDEHKE